MSTQQPYSAILRTRLTEARIQRGWSQAELAAQLGTTQVNVSRWERGITRPTPYFRNKLCILLGKNAQELDLETPSAFVSGTIIYDPVIPSAPPFHLVGREEIFSRLKQRLGTWQSSSPIVLYGLPGVGKTTLAISLARDEEVRNHFVDGVLWAGLGPDPDVAGLLGHWGSLLGLSLPEKSAASSQAWGKRLRAALAQRSMLLVIDDAWQAEEALSFLHGGPTCAHLITTRFPLIASQLTLDEGVALSELTTRESVTLLRQLAPGVVAREPQSAGNLAQAVGGLPLALKLVGNYLRTQSYSSQPRRIQAALDHLRDASARLRLSEPTPAGERHPSLPAQASVSLQSVIAVTDQRLDPFAREALYALAVLPAKPHSFSEEAALAVAACPVETLDLLSDAGLLESNRDERYTLHQTIADYARAQLRTCLPRERLVRYIADYAEAHKADYALLAQDSSVIQAALETAHELGRKQELLRTFSAFVPFLIMRGNYASAERSAQRAYEAAVDLKDEEGTVLTLLYLGRLAHKRGNNTQALAYLQEGLTLARRVGNPRAISELLRHLGHLRWKQGQFALAGTSLQEGLALAREIDYRECVMDLLCTSGSLATSQGRYEQSLIYLQEGLTLARQAGDCERTCDLLLNQAVALAELDRNEEAEACLQETLALAQQMGLMELISIALLNLGESGRKARDYVVTESYLQEGLSLTRQLEQPEWTCAFLINLAETANDQKDDSKAARYLQECALLAQPLNIPRITCCYLHESGRLALNQRRLESAEAYLQQMLASIPAGEIELLAMARHALARLALARSDFEQARSLGLSAVMLLDETGHWKRHEMRRWLESIAWPD